MFWIPLQTGVYYILVPSLILCTVLWVLRRALRSHSYPFQDLASVKSVEKLDENLHSVRFWMVSIVTTLAMISTCFSIAQWPNSTRYLWLNIVVICVQIAVMIAKARKLLTTPSAGLIWSLVHFSFMLTGSYVSGSPAHALVDLFAPASLFLAYSFVCDISVALLMFAVMGLFIMVVQAGLVQRISEPWLCIQSMQEASTFLPILVVAAVLMFTALNTFLENYRSSRIALFFEESARMKDEFLATVTHDIRTPVHGILGCANLLNNDLQMLDEVHQEQVSVISHCASVLSLLVENILTAGASQIEFQLEETLLHDFFDNFFSTMQNLVYGSKILFRIIYKQDRVPVSMKLHKKAIFQVLLNLGSNAIKFDGKAITLIIDILDNGSILVELQDRGVGISPAFARTKLFCKYSRDFETATAGGFTASGTGLGLSICKKICDSIGAELGYRPNADRGSVFSILIPSFDEAGGRPSMRPKPLKTLSASQSPAPSPEEHSPSTPRLQLDSQPCLLDILVVDDNPVNVKVLEMFISRFPIGTIGRCQTASNGAAALEVLLKRVQDTNIQTHLVVLLDQQMPLLSGNKTIRHWRRLEKDLGQRRPSQIIAVTASTEASVDMRLFSSYLSKPVKFTDLEAQLFPKKAAASLFLKP